MLVRQPTLKKVSVPRAAQIEIFIWVETFSNLPTQRRRRKDLGASSLYRDPDPYRCAERRPSCHVSVPIADSRSEVMVLRAHLAEADLDIF
jgi:hypothetical protein